MGNHIGLCLGGATTLPQHLALVAATGSLPINVSPAQRGHLREVRERVGQDLSLPMHLAGSSHLRLVMIQRVLPGFCTLNVQTAL